MKTVVVVAISETLVTHEEEVDTMVFDSMAKARAWIERQIEEKVKVFHLNRV